jgi:cyclic pyranopterin phosphate synthase
MTDRIIPITDARRAKPLPAGSPAAAGGTLTDTRGRHLHDLRISVTDRCNFRCTYCMPKEVFDKDYAYLPHGALLSFEEITRIARVFAGQGVQKIRLTGGEPLLRKHIERLVEMLAAIPGIDLTLTTNGSLLAKKARDLKNAGLNRVTVSLDAIDDATFKAMNDADYPVADVLAGIDAAAAAGLTPVKVNMVVKRGANDHAILPMARHFKGSGHILRFIEFMDVGASNGWRMDDVVPSADVIAMINSEMPLAVADANYSGEVAERWRYSDGSGEIGVISSVTQAFCSTCTRLRLSTEGMLYTCLFATDGYDLRGMLRGTADDAALTDAVRRIWQARGDRYSEIRTADTRRDSKIEMSYIGG